jgi:hypothetical protein
LPLGAIPKLLPISWSALKWTPEIGPNVKV